MKRNITFVIFTYNEASRIEKVVKNYIGFGDVLIFDGGSTDNTREIAKELGAKVKIREVQYEFAENQATLDEVYEAITTEWLFWGAADEMMDKDTLTQIEAVISSNNYDIISIDRKNYFYGRFCYNLYHARTNKIFKKYSIDYSDNAIHDMGKITTLPKRVYKMPDKYFVHHFMSYDAEAFMNTFNIYTKLELNYEYKMRSPVLYFCFLIIKSFFVNFIKEKGYKCGYQGIALIEMMIFYKWLKNMKHYEKGNELTRTKIEVLNDKFRNDILNVFYK